MHGAFDPELSAALCELALARGGAAARFAHGTGKVPWAWVPGVEHPQIDPWLARCELPSAIATWWEPDSDDAGADALALQADECDAIIDVALHTPAEWRSDGGGARCTSWTLADADVVGPLANKLWDVADVANACWWRLETAELRIRVHRYRPGKFHGTHYDCHPGQMNRKMALLAQLSDTDDYTGGDLMLSAWRDDVAAPRTRGTVVAVPGWCHHAVTPIRSGERWSLVAWLYGPPLR